MASALAAVQIRGRRHLAGHGIEKDLRDAVAGTIYSGTSEIQQNRIGIPPAAEVPVLVKVCGARTEADLEVLREPGVDLVGLWHGVPDGHADLDLGTALAWPRPPAAGRSRARARHPRGGPRGGCRRATGVRWVQLHGYGRPVSVRRLRDAGPGVASSRSST